MKLQMKLSLGFAGILAVVAFAGCTGGNPLATPTTSPSAAPTPNTNRLYFQQVAFYTANDANQGLHYVTIKNGTSNSVTLSNYALAYDPLTNNTSTSSQIVDANGHPVATLAAGATISVYLESSVDLTTAPAGSAATTFGNNAVQYTRGGGLALFSSTTSTASANIVDFVQWGRNNTRYESVADQAALWAPNTTVATVSAGTSGVYLNPTTAGATGSANWKFTAY